MTQIVDMAAFRGPTAQMVDLSKFTFWGPPQDMDFFYKQSTRTGRAWLKKLTGRTVSYNQLFNGAGTSATIPSGHKYYLYTGGVGSVATSTGATLTAAAADDMLVDLTQAGLANIITTPEQFEAWQMEQFGNNDYIAYTPGKLVSVNPTGIKTTTPGGDEHTLPLDFTEHFPNGLNGVNDVVDEVVSDENGKFTEGDVRFGKVDLGTLSWTKTTTAVPNTTCFQATMQGADFGIAICAKYYLAGPTRYILATKDKAFAPYNETNSRNTIVVRDSDYDNASAADFKTAMSGVELIYELATPQHVTFTDPSDAVYPVTEGGTEQVLPVNGSDPATGPLLGKVSYKQGRSAQ